MSTLVIFLDIYIYIFFGVMTPQIDYVPRILLRIVANFLHTCIRDCRFFSGYWSHPLAYSPHQELIPEQFFFYHFYYEPNNGIVTLQYFEVVSGTMGTIQTTRSEQKQFTGIKGGIMDCSITRNQSSDKKVGC